MPAALPASLRPRAARSPGRKKHSPSSLLDTQGSRRVRAHGGGGTEVRRRSDAAGADDQLVEHEIVFGIGADVAPVHVAADQIDVAPDAAGARVIHVTLGVQAGEHTVLR